MTILEVARIANAEEGTYRPPAGRGVTAEERAGLALYHQTDPRGAAIYALRPGDIPAGVDVDSCYSRGIAIY